MRVEIAQIPLTYPTWCKYCGQYSNNDYTCACSHLNGYWASLPDEPDDAYFPPED